MTLAQNFPSGRRVFMSQSVKMNEASWFPFNPRIYKMPGATFTYSLHMQM